MSRSCLSVVLGAGEGTRMKSSLPKVLHKIAGLPLIGHVVQAMEKAGFDQLAVVVGRGAQDVQDFVSTLTPNAAFFEQKERLGTAHAALAARELLAKNYDDVLIVFGDTPLIEAEALSHARQELKAGGDIVVMGFYSDTPHGYGRLIIENGKLQAIVEEKEATNEQKKIKFCNGGLMAINGKHALSLLEKIENNNAKGEYYLTDIVALGATTGLDVRAIEIPFDNVIGINNRLELSQAEHIWQQRCRKAMMLDGVTMQAPESVYFSFDTKIAADVEIEPNVVFGPKVEVSLGAIIHSFSHIEGAFIGENASIGPFARLRPGAKLGAKSRVGNFCEIKNAQIGIEAKVNHLSYIGDAEIGERANIGAGTITCNYDGFNKWQTKIGDDAFIGSNSALIAPVTIGNGAYVGSGSVVSDNVPADALALARARQVNKEDKAKSLRAYFSSLKTPK